MIIVGLVIIQLMTGTDNSAVYCIAQNVDEGNSDVLSKYIPSNI